MNFVRAGRPCPARQVVRNPSSAAADQATRVRLGAACCAPTVWVRLEPSNQVIGGIHSSSKFKLSELPVTIHPMRRNLWMGDSDLQPNCPMVRRHANKFACTGAKVVAHEGVFPAPEPAKRKSCAANVRRCHTMSYTENAFVARPNAKNA